MSEGSALSQTSFSLLGDEVIQRQVEQPPVELDDARIVETFELPRCERAINDGKYQKVGLQFPDELLPYATQIYTYLRTHTDSHLFIMGDTSYGSCCVDEVAAEHATADLIIHFGQSCLSRTTRLPTLFVFGQQSIDVDDCVRKTTQSIVQDRELLLVSAVGYVHALGAVSILFSV
eukprot:TRINITY_DN10005_c0_g1_i4.p2 TRINITY_DN10005_c0_g1~~TRINITY_DN10005_c0_g1_i4.p2  ORF type:complete len:193 (+),score=26.60 TRINITY_DN10005_c0_g1_i4:54-581(+)